jgi:hypothetical protein
VLTALLALPTQVTRAHESGISFWTPGFFGSLAAVPQQTPGWSAALIYCHDSVSAGGDVARAPEIAIGRAPANLTANLNASVNANVDLGLVAPVLGGQVSQ